MGRLVARKVFFGLAIVTVATARLGVEIGGAELAEVG